MKQRIVLLLLTAVLILSLCACSGGAGASIRYDLAAPVEGLDPQFATSAEAKTVIANCFTGLLRQNAAGDVELAAAQSMDISPDRRTYSFVLRDDLAWSDGTPLTAMDFAFGLRRLFGPGVVSPYAAEFACIQNGQAILNGILSPESLGVEAKDDKTLVITLDYHDAFFERILTSVAAMPCNETFFSSTMGRYGLDGKSVLCNGDFTIKNWGEKRIDLTRNPHALFEVLPDQLHFYIERENPQQLLLGGKADAGILPLESIEAAADAGMSYEAYNNTVWVIAFNQQNEYLADKVMRSALQMALDTDALDERLSKGYIPTREIVPPSTLMYSQLYRELAGAVLETHYIPDAARELYKQTLTAMEKNSMTGVTLLVPDTGAHALYAGYLQQMWQQNLSCYINVEMVPQDQFLERINTRNYQIALMPLRSAVPDPTGILGQFVSQSSDNCVSYQSGEYDRLVADAAQAATAQEAVEYCAHAEDLLINDSVVIPLYLTTSYFVAGRGVAGVEYSPYSGQAVFRGVTKK